MATITKADASLPSPIEKHIVSVPATAPMAAELRWQCQVCGQEMGHSQPVALDFALTLLGAFIEHHHEKCGAKPARKEVAAK